MKSLLAQLSKAAAPLRHTLLLPHAATHRPPAKGQPPAYAYPCDGSVYRTLQSRVVQRAVRRFTEVRCRQQLEQLRQEGMRVTPKAFPALYETYAACCHALSLAQRPELYLTPRLRGINALSVEAGGEPLIFISRQVTYRLTQPELRFVLGHELGHTAQGLLTCQMVYGLLHNPRVRDTLAGAALYDMMERPLSRWCRCAELTADRAGLLCCRDMEAVRRLFARIDRRLPSYYRLAEQYKAHPYAQTRLEELTRFAATLEGTAGGTEPDKGLPAHTPLT